MNRSGASARRVVAIAPSGDCVAQLYGQSVHDRLARTFARVGAELVLHAPATGASMPEAPNGSLLVARGSADRGEQQPRPSEPIVVVRADAVLDERVARALLESEPLLLVAEDGAAASPVAAVIGSARAPEAAAWIAGRPAPSGLVLRTPRELVPAYTSELRKRASPFLRIATPENAPAIERGLFDASYKGVTDFVTKFAWPPIAFPVVRACARLGITPNAVTLASWALAGFATLEFERGAFLSGLAAAWAMTFLDTVDGKLARVTQTSSSIGHWLDHGLDLAHPPVWWGAWALGVGLSLASPACVVVLAGYLVGRLLEGAFLLACGFETHCWRPLDSAFRLVTARRNPNLVLLTLATLAGAPALGFHAIAWWTGISITFHVARLAQALALRAAGRRPRPWEEEAALAGARTAK